MIPERKFFITVGRDSETGQPLVSARLVVEKDDQNGAYKREYSCFFPCMSENEAWMTATGIVANRGRGIEKKENQS